MWHHPLSIRVTLLMPCKTVVAVTSQGTRSSSKQNHLRFLLQIFAYRLSHGHMNVDHTLVSCPIFRGCWYAVLTLKDFPFPFLGLTILQIISGHRSPPRSSWTLSISSQLAWGSGILRLAGLSILISILAHSLDKGFCRAHTMHLLWANLDTGQRRDTIVNDAYLRAW